MSSPMNLNEAVSIVDEIYDNLVPLTKDFIEKCQESNFKDITKLDWMNLVTTLASSVMRIDKIKGNEKLIEAVLYQLILRVIKDLPIDDNETRESVLVSFRLFGPQVIDIIVPPPGGHGCACNIL